MAIDRELRLLIEYAHLPEPNDIDNNHQTISTGIESPVRVPVQEIYNKLIQVRDQQVIPRIGLSEDINLPELLVLIAEASIYQQDYSIAAQCVEWFLSDCSIKNQFYCRIQLVQARCTSHEADGDTGSVKLRKVLNAIHFVLLVLPIATDSKRRPHYDFLVYNTSLTYWHIARQLMKKSTFQYLIPSLQTILDALKMVGEKDILWIVRIQMTLVYAQLDGKQLAGAVKTINDLVETQLNPLLNDPIWSNDVTFKALYEEAYRLQIHIGTFKDSECQKLIPNLKKTSISTKRTSLLFKLQLVKSGMISTSLETALIELIQDNIEMPTLLLGTTSENQIINHVHSIPIDGEILVETGILGAFHHELRIAMCCDLILSTKTKSLTPKLRVLHQVLKAILIIVVPPSSKDYHALNQDQRHDLLISRRIEGIKGMERALGASKRQQDANLIETICIYVWNLSLPLLQPQYRGQLQRIMMLASSCLEEVQSLLYHLRVGLFLEIAKLEMTLEFLSNAQGTLEKALRLDYGTIKESFILQDVLKQDFQRDLDVHLIPLKKRVDLKLSIEDSRTIEQDLASTIEEMYDTKDRTQRCMLLKRAVEYAKVCIEKDVMIIDELNTISLFAWQMKEIEIGREMTREAIRLYFSQDKIYSKNIMAIEVELRLRLIEMIAMEIQTQAQTCPIEEKDVYILGWSSTLEEMSQHTKDIYQLKLDILEQFTHVLHTSSRIGWSFIVENTAIYIWNYHIHLFRMILDTSKYVNGILPQCVLLWEQTLIMLQTHCESNELLTSFGLGLCLFYQQMGQMDKMLSVVDSFLKQKSRCSPVHYKRLMEMKIKAQWNDTIKEYIPTETHLFFQILCYLQVLELTNGYEKGYGLYQKIKILWSVDTSMEILTTTLATESNSTLEEQQQMIELYMEIWVRLGCHAFRFQQMKDAIRSTDYALRLLTILTPCQQTLWIHKTSWKWFGMAELVASRAMLSLLSGETAAWILIQTIFERLVHAAEYVSESQIDLQMIGETAWNTMVTTLDAVEQEKRSGIQEENELVGWKRILPIVSRLISHLKPIRSHLLGELILLVLDVCEKANTWDIGIEICQTIKDSCDTTISSLQRKDITTFYAIAIATVGKQQSSTSLLNGKDIDPLIQAKILKKIAFSSWKIPSTQLKALSNAYRELEGYREEQALVLMDIAEWFHTHYFPYQEIESYLEMAETILQIDNDMYTLLWYTEKRIRLYTIRAFTAVSMIQRWEQSQNTLVQIHIVWQILFKIANEYELRQRYEQETSTVSSIKTKASVPVTILPYEEWKVNQTSIYPFQVPLTGQEWIRFYQQHATSSTAFYLLWLKPLQAAQQTSPPIVYFTQAVHTMTLLEKLVEMIFTMGHQELVLPILCLYQVLYYLYIPQHSKCIELWIELMLYRTLEHLNMNGFHLPLQKALEILDQECNGILKELQQQDERITQGKEQTRYRLVLQVCQLDVARKCFDNINLLLTFGYIRQAKVLLTMLTSIAQRKDKDHEIMIWCSLLQSRVYEVEGQHGDACELVTQVVESSGSIEIILYIKQILRLCDLTEDKDKAIATLMDAERKVAQNMMMNTDCPMLNQQHQGVIKYMASLVGGNSASSKSGNSNASLNTISSTGSSSSTLAVDVDIVIGLAELKLKRARFLLLQAKEDKMEMAQQVFHECIDLLTLIDSKKKRAECSIEFAQLLWEKSNGITGVIATTMLLDARTLLQHAVILLQELYSRVFETKNDTDAIVPIAIEIASTKVLLAQLELHFEQASEVIMAQQMTWYTYDRNSQRSIVDKWLDETAPEVKLVRHGSLSQAFTLATAAHGMLITHNIEGHSLVTTARAIKLQCRRVAMYHSRNETERNMLQTWLWTRFTTEEAKYMTWVCCSSLDTIANITTESSPVNQLESQLAQLANELELELKVTLEQRRAPTNVIGIVSYELAQVYGCSRPLECLRSLLQYQSVIVRDQHMIPLIKQCLSASNVSKLHMMRLESLLNVHMNPERNSLPFQLSQLYLEQQSDIYKRMSVNTVNVETILSGLPSTMRILTLQISPDRCFLYAGFTGTSGETQGACVIGRMELTVSKLNLLSSLKVRIGTWRRGMAKALLAMEEKVIMNQTDIHEFFESVEKDGTMDKVETEFNSIIAEMITFFSPLFEHRTFARTLDEELSRNTLVLLVDRELEVLPLEALPIFEAVDAITRDFSLHVLHHRLASVKAHPFRRDDVRVVVDAHHDDLGLANQTITTCIQQLTKKPGTIFPNWKDAVDHGQPPTTTDWQQAMMGRRAGSVCYIGPNRFFGSALSLPILASMNLSSSCYALFLLDRAENNISARRQAKIDSEKKAWERSLEEEDLYACALLTSLVGVNVMVMNQWTTTFHSSRRLTTAFITGLGHGQSIAKAVRKYPELVTPITGIKSQINPKQSRKSSTDSRGSVQYTTPPTQQSRKSSTDSRAAAQNTTAPSTSLTEESKAPIVFLKNRIRYNTIVYGLGHLTMKNEN